MPLRIGDRDEAADGAGAAARLRLDGAAAALYADLRPTPVLEGLIGHSARATGSSSGAVSVVDHAAGTYIKAAEHGVACQVGRSFPLDEGATGRAVELRRPVALRDYAQLNGGHLTGAAGHRSVLAVPAWWRDEVIAVNVVFRPPGVGFDTATVDAVEALTQVAAPALHLVGEHPEEPLGALLRRRIGIRRDAVVTETGPRARLAEPVVAAAADAVTAIDRAFPLDPAARLRIAVVHRDRGVRLLVHREAPAGDPAPAAVRAALLHSIGPLASSVAVDDVPGWGLAVQVDLAVVEAALTDRERQVLQLVRQGMTDRAIGHALACSPKTVEKHVGAVLKKTGARNRTAAVAIAIDRGWV